MPSHFRHVWLFATPWTVVCQALLSMRFSRQENWSGLPFPIQRIFQTHGSSPCLFTSPGLQADSLSLVPFGKHTFVFVQSLSCVWLFVTPWTAACQASLSFTISRNLLKFMSIESVMPSNHLTKPHLSEQLKLKIWQYQVLVRMPRKQNT